MWPHIRYVRDSFFAARSWRDIDDLNAQAQAWCEGIAAERPWPEDHSISVREAFERERGCLIALPGDRFPADERVEVIRVTPFGLAPLTGQPSADPAIVASGAKASISLTTSITAGRPAAKAVSSEPARSAGCSTRRPSAPMASAIVAKLTSL